VLNAQFQDDHGPRTRTQGPVLDCSNFNVTLATGETMRLDQVPFIPFRPDLFEGMSKDTPFVLTLRDPNRQEEYVFRGYPAHLLRRLIYNLSSTTPGWPETIARTDDGVWNAGVVASKSYLATLFGVVNWEFLQLFQPCEPVHRFQSQIDHSTLQHVYMNNTDLVVPSVAVAQSLSSTREALFNLQNRDNLAGCNPKGDLAAKLTDDNERLRLPLDAGDLHVFDSILKIIINFHLRPEGKGESLFVSLLWYPILRAILTDRFPLVVHAVTEFEVQRIDSNLEQQFVDFVAVKPLLPDGQSSRPPTFFVEASQHKIATDINSSKGYLHKDFAKLIKCMRASLSYYWGLFGSLPQIRSKLCVYGAFLAGNQIQYCLMRPIVLKNADTAEIIPEESFSALFQTHPHWIVDLSDAGRNSCVAGGQCDLGICEQFPAADDLNGIKGKQILIESLFKIMANQSALFAIIFFFKPAINQTMRPSKILN
jgi:hypothetical protein